MTRVAAVDCGTNTVKLLIADLDPSTGEEAELVRESRMVRLGQGVDRTGRLADEALERVFAAVEEYAALVAEHQAERVRFCATSASRDASNADVFADGVEKRLGTRPEVVSGAEEARLSFDGATRHLGVVPSPVLVVDIGGGSTELVLGSATGGSRPVVDAGRSLDIGSVRMTERHLHSDPPTDVQVGAASADVQSALDRLPAYGVQPERARTVVAVSGTGLTVAAAALDLDGLDRARIDGAVVPLGAVREAAVRLLSMSVQERLGLPYMHPGRADVIGAGALILDAVLRRTRVDELRVSVRDILDGIAWSCL
ncbi:MAG: exopolyphosphatase / guanosine-5-triphosphate,3-diphosphate pyrophosphatase [Nocardioidaceae bacterium]|nr:exopolyphosphatase / guanosine-5-triphosphate,3-diphosphate pyrophosphatase [Nocardioidaceae bacterium]